MTRHPVDRATGDERVSAAQAIDPRCSPSGHRPPEPRRTPPPPQAACKPGHAGKGTPRQNLTVLGHGGYMREGYRRGGGAPEARAKRPHAGTETDPLTTNPPGRTQRPRTPGSPELEGPRQLAAGQVIACSMQSQPAARAPPFHSNVQEHGGEQPLRAVASDPGRRADAARPKRR